MTTTDEIRDDLLGFLAARLPAGEALTEETDLLDDELLDSLLIMDTVAHVESRYGVRLDHADLAPRNFRSVAALAGLVGRKAVS